MDRIHLYNTETGLRRNLFAGIFHEVLTHQHPNCDVVTAKDGTAPQPIPFALEGTEHIVFSDDGKVVYGRTYLAVSTSPEAGIRRRLNRIINIANPTPAFPLTRVILALAVECPRDCESNADNVAQTLGKREIQFELWEAKDFRQPLYTTKNDKPFDINEL
jgi:hypothetical protein